RCTSCHGSTAPKGGLTLTPAATAYGELVGKPSEGSVCSAAGTKRVVPQDPATSQLYLKVTNDPAKCGGKMPTTGSLTAAQQATIRAWIEAGALND
ncbi:MAG: hypothetical protein ACO3JL_12390, partial [Myxococcota bacterium]